MFGTTGMSFAQSAYAAAQVFGRNQEDLLRHQEQQQQQQPQQQQPRQQQQQPGEGAIPPASQSALRKLPVVKVTAEDLIQDGNDSCCVCLDPQHVGDLALKLPCGHLYHRECAVDWLQRHCTCPNCRYELETDDAAYEPARRRRMGQRKPRYRLRALEKLKVGELRKLLADARLSDVGCSEKRDLVQRLVLQHAVQIVSEPPPLDVGCATADLGTWTTKRLKDVCASVGVDSAHCLEKSELIDQLVASGRVEFSVAPPEAKRRDCDDDDARDDRCATPDSEGAAEPPPQRPRNADGLDPRPPAAAAGAEPGQQADGGAVSRADVEAMSVRQLKDALISAGLEAEVQGCIDKDHLRRILSAALLPDDAG
ncbi:hypothetical protein M885DRAFT_624606 [Pelagophyceae sp. CCMP2097]|nr:hypothetical protein M885DRAFT_624606 [Pelagophyceae sp. CCMP2097]